MMDFIKDIPAALRITSTLGYWAIALGSVFGPLFMVLWAKDSADTINYNRSKNIDWHSELSYWRLVVAVILIGIAAFFFISAYNQIPRLTE